MQSQERDIIFILHLHPAVARVKFLRRQAWLHHKDVEMHFATALHLSRFSCLAKVSRLIMSFLQPAETLSSLEKITAHQPARF